LPASSQHPVQAVREDGFTLVGGVRIHYEAWGRGDPVVLIHGLGSCAAAFRGVGPVLAEAGYRALALDLPGCGLAARPATGYTRRELAATVLGFLDNLSIGTARALVGHSMGGAIALEIAATRPERVELVAVVDGQAIVSGSRLLSAAAPALPLVGEVAAALTRLAPVATRRVATRLYLHRIFRDPRRIPEELVAAYATCADAGYQRAMFRMLRHLGDTADLAQAVRTLPQPALLVWGRDDVVCPAELGEELLEALPDAELKVLEACGHSPAEERPHELAELLVDFFARRGPRAAPRTAATAGTPPSLPERGSPGPGGRVPARRVARANRPAAKRSRPRRSP
jgi:pimeloyl-ACP methyl ester carboxylesterase